MFCPANISFFDVHVSGGISQCCMDTITNAFLVTYLLVFGIWQLWKYGASQSLSLPKPKLYSLQLFVTYFLSPLAIVRFFVQLKYVYDGQVYGFMVIAAVVPLIIFPFSAHLIKKEHGNVSTAPGQGHSVVLLIFWTILLIFESMVFINIHRDDWWFHMKTTPAKIEMALFITQYVSSWLLFVLGLLAPGIISPEYSNLNQANEENSQNQRTDTEPSTWRGAWKKVRTLAPYVWPKNNLNLQSRIVVCLILILAERLINVLIPYYSKLLVDSMTGDNPAYRWDYVLILVGVEFLENGGLLSNARTFLWTTVELNTTRKLQVELFRHLHSLSLRWHLSRETGEVLRMMDRGTSSISNMLSWVIFDIIPTSLDIIIAIVYFVTFFTHWFGVIVLVTMSLYVVSSILFTEWEMKYHRSANEAYDKSESSSVDSLLNFETVKYYGAEDYEVNKYNQSILSLNTEQWKSRSMYALENFIQSLILSAGLLGGSLLCVYEVVETKQLTVGDYVLFTSYLMQVCSPLRWFASFYRYIQNSFVDMEKMLDLLAEEPEIKDSPLASTLVVENGEIEFQDVTFSYIPEKPILKNVSFKVEPGKTTAIVGPSGSGKTTIMRLIFRFFDVNSGLISIDGQNIRMVTQKSLREAIGVVPQDTVLFNTTIKHNIEYGRIGASESDLINAAKSADIHERILTFKDKYDTVVGERGLKLSGGEKQRIAIARTILKAPHIVLLDEATSSLDTLSERNIQAALNNVCQNKTTIIIAHRLSTIIHADEILVLKDGEICERGRHQDLINSDGLYASMWQQQLENNQSTNDPVSPTEESNEKL